MPALMYGLTIQRAEQWRAMWVELGWWDDMFAGTGNAQAFELIARAGLPPNSNQPENYWMFSCRLSPANWGIGRVELGDEVMQQPLGRGESRYLVATRCQFVLFDLSGSALYLLPFESISSTAMKRDVAAFRFHNGKECTFSVNARGPRMLDRARHRYWSFTDNTAERYLAGQVVGAAKADQTEFLEVVKSFVTEIANIGKMAPAKSRAEPRSFGGRHSLIESLAREDRDQEAKKVSPSPAAQPTAVDIASYNDRVYVALEARRAHQFQPCRKCGGSVAETELNCPDCGTDRL